MTHIDLPIPRIADGDIGGITLRAIDLSGLRLAGLRAERTDLTGADLRNIRAAGIRLTGSNLRWARLEGADLSHADLRGADLSDATHDGTTNWTGVTISATTVLPDDLDLRALAESLIVDPTPEPL